MPNPLPVLRLTGTVRAVKERTVDSVPARDPEYDDAGNQTKPGYPERDGYDVLDVTILTPGEGGFATVVFRDEAIRDAEGYTPTVGEDIDIPVRCFTSWQQSGGRRYVVVGYSFAGAVYAAEAKSRTGGRRSGADSPVSVAS